MTDSPYWIVGAPDQSALKLYWVDDVFLPTEAQEARAPRRDAASPSFYRAQLDAIKSGDSLSAMGADNFVNRIRALMNIGVRNNVSCALLNFEQATQMLAEPPGDVSSIRLFLIDVQNNFSEDTSIRDTYGYHFAAREDIARGYRRFCTRNRAPGFLAAARKILGDDLSETDDFLSVEPETFEPAVERWIQSSLVHDDPQITTAIRAFQSAWDHVEQDRNVLQTFFGALHEQIERQADRVSQTVLKWLKLKHEDVEWDGDLLKGLLLPAEYRSAEDDWQRQGWRDGDARKPRDVPAIVLRAVLDRLEIPVSGPWIQTDHRWRLPVSPALPFLTALRAFILQIGVARVEFGVQEISPSNPTAKLLYWISLEVPDREAGDRTLTIGGLRSTFFRRPPEDTRGATRLALHALVRARTYGLKGTFTERAERDVAGRYFSQGCDDPVVAVEFGPQSLTLMWTAAGE